MDYSRKSLNCEYTQRISHNIYQDNKSAIWWLSTEKSKHRRSRHILIKTTYIKEKIIYGDIVLEYLSTDEMVANVLTKPLQGEKFQQFIKRIIIMHTKINNKYIKTHFAATMTSIQDKRRVEYHSMLQLPTERYHHHHKWNNGN